MLILTSSIALQYKLQLAPLTTNLDYTASWVDITSSAVTPGVSTGTLSATSATDLVAAPAASTHREILTLSIYNNDTFPALINLLTTSSVSVYFAWLQIGETLHYENNIGFYVIDRSGARIQKEVSEAAGFYQSGSPTLNGAIYPTNQSNGVIKRFYKSHADITTLTGTRTIASNTTEFVYLGEFVPFRQHNSNTTSTNQYTFDVRYRVTTAAVTITWAEVAVYMGYPTGGDTTLVLLGYTDVSAVVNSTGQKTTTVNISNFIHIPPGVGIWAAIGNSASTAVVVRAGNAPRVEAGLRGSASIRPSTAGNTVTMTESANATPWMTGKMN